MTQSTLNILIADDDEGDRKQIRHILKQGGLACECIDAASIEEALEACGKWAFDCAIVDYKMPGYDGLHGINAMHERLPDMSIIMATGQGDEMVATEAMKRGASDYIPKMHIHAESIRRVIENAMEKAALRRKVAQQREELENFARVLVHDLRAPIHSIYGFADFVEQCIKEERPGKIVGHFDRVLKAVQRMNTLIDTLYQYTKIDAQVALAPVEMGPVLEDTLSNLEHFIQEHGACVTHDELPAVTGNASQLIQLLQNLISNSIKYCEAKIPSIHVAARPQEGAAWLFSVKDNGIGISKQDYKAVFEPFKRLHDEDKYEGTGLGLATCMKIVERHGGIIWCESEKGQGTTFFFTLPKADSHA
ncbi:MAG: response regulator [Proteobacteria bacterium]|nr:response regulator [Pseudomonadota bacterium]